MIFSKPLFHLTAFATTIFIITILAMVAMLMGDPQAPINLWFNEYGAVVLTVEVLAIGISGMAAMIADRRETVREYEEKIARQKAKEPGEPESKGEVTPWKG